MEASELSHDLDSVAVGPFRGGWCRLVGGKQETDAGSLLVTRARQRGHAQQDAACQHTLERELATRTCKNPRLEHWGMLHLVSDICPINGIVLLDHTNRVLQITLSPLEPLARELSIGLAAMLQRREIAVILAKLG